MAAKVAASSCYEELVVQSCALKAVERGESASFLRLPAAALTALEPKESRLLVAEERQRLLLQIE
jgi:hypothetical protein